MAVQTLKLHSQQSNGVTFVDPLDPDYSVKVKTNANVKMLDGQRATNYVTEIIANDNFGVTLPGGNVPDALSVRIRVSGSGEAHSRLKQMLTDVCTTLITDWLSEDVLLGFQPVTLPVNTVV